MKYKQIVVLYCYDILHIHNNILLDANNAYKILQMSILKWKRNKAKTQLHHIWKPNIIQLPNKIIWWILTFMLIPTNKLHWVKLLKPTTQLKSPIQDNKNKSLVKQKNSYIQLMSKLIINQVLPNPQEWMKT